MGKRKRNPLWKNSLWFRGQNPDFKEGEDVWFLYSKPLRMMRGAVCHRRYYNHKPFEPKDSDVYCMPDELDYCVRLRDFEAFHTKEELQAHYLQVIGLGDWVDDSTDSGDSLP